MSGWNPEMTGISFESTSTFLFSRSLSRAFALDSRVSNAYVDLMYEEVMDGCVCVCVC